MSVNLHFEESADVVVVVVGCRNVVDVVIATVVVIADIVDVVITTAGSDVADVVATVVAVVVVSGGVVGVATAVRTTADIEIE